MKASSIKPHRDNETVVSPKEPIAPSAQSKHPSGVDFYNALKAEELLDSYKFPPESVHKKA